MFCKTKIAVLIAIHWKFVCEIIRGAISESLSYKL